MEFSASPGVEAMSVCHVLLDDGHKQKMEMVERHSVRALVDAGDGASVRGTAGAAVDEDAALVDMLDWDGQLAPCCNYAGDVTYDVGTVGVGRDGRDGGGLALGGDDGR